MKKIYSLIILLSLTQISKSQTMNNTALIKKFYESFAIGDAESMVSCYAPNILFKDPAFGELKGDDAKNMWRMLIDVSKGNLKITCDKVEANDKTGTANWKAEYTFSLTGRKVVNRVSANFEFENGKIVKHTDQFKFWKWTRQALGWKGYLFGWTQFMHKKVQENANSSLKKYIDKQTK